MSATQGNNGLLACLKSDNINATIKSNAFVKCVDLILQYPTIESCSLWAANIYPVSIDCIVDLP